MMPELIKINVHTIISSIRFEQGGISKHAKFEISRIYFGNIFFRVLSFGGNRFGSILLTMKKWCRITLTPSGGGGGNW